jgi:glucose 1-dehydrogenase
MSLHGKVAFITGGARGIGRGCAVELAREGASIAFCDMRQSDDVDETRAAIAALGRRAEFFLADVADRPAIEKAIAGTVERLGRLDILVNNAAKSLRRSFLDMEVAELARVWDVILWGAFHASQIAARQMVKQGSGGNIVMISSVHAFRPYAGATAYNAAKAGVNHMAFTCASELAPHGIRVNVIEPGWTDTPGERLVFTAQQIRDEGAKLPLRRLAQPEEIGKAVAYLVSDAGAYITGACLRVDGGYVLWR